MQDHRKLRVWRRAHLNALRARRACDAFPAGYANLKSQLSKSVESVPYNIAEGCGADGPREFGRFLQIAIKSTTEVESQILLAVDYGILAFPQWRKLHRKNTIIRQMLHGLRKRVLRQDDGSNA